MVSAALIAPPERSAHSEQTDRGPVYRCGCGHVLKVFGGGRHRVYFELGDSRFDDPVMNRVCPACGCGLAGKNGSLIPGARAGIPTRTPEGRL
jgi:hypothetical protein